MTEKIAEVPLKILLIAQEEARRLGDTTAGTEHVLLALSSLENPAASALNGFGITYADVKTELEGLRSQQNALGVEVEIELSERSKQCLELSYLEASTLKHQVVGAEHMLLAIIRLGEGVAIGILSKFGISVADLEIALLYQCSSALAAPLSDVGKELETQIEVWNRLSVIAREQDYQDLVQEAARHTKMYKDALHELKNASDADVRVTF